MKLEQAPVTGQETQADATPQMAALSQFYRALNTRDMQLMSRNWWQSDEAVMDNPVGGIKRGWDEIREVYARVFANPAPFRFEFYDYSFHQTPELFYVAGRERGEYRTGDVVLPMAIRTSRLFRLIDGQWKQAHHHGSIDDPGLLLQYQQAVRGAPA
ncbi:MAG TPA: nuclear transport factor 2 family protein [Rhodanobacteraceae bacterium]|nr:nuclear transport factor 2 family protein [Rhodanobacteraceae bacterium]